MNLDRIQKARFAVVVGLLISFTIGLFAAEASPVNQVQKAVGDWAKVRDEQARLESTWEWERDLLTSTLNALQQRVLDLENQKKVLTAQTDGERISLADLTAQNTAATNAINSAKARLEQISGELIRLRPWLPPRLSLALDLPYRSLANPELTPGERMQHVMTVLNRSAQFNHAISYGDETLTLPGESEVRLLEVIYWGSSHAYALDRSNQAAYVGSPGTLGWAWEAAPDAANAVAHLIDMTRDRADPDFVEVPARLSNVVAGSAPRSAP